MLQGGAELLAEADYFLPGERTAAVENIRQRLALDELHGEERRALVPAGGVETDDVGMLELFENRGLALEPCLRRFTLQRSWQHDFDGDRQPGLCVDRPVDATHSAAADLLLHEKRADMFADEHGSISA